LQNRRAYSIHEHLSVRNTDPGTTWGHGADKNRYIYYMIEDFGIAKDEGEIAIYAGMVTSAFTFAEFSAVR